MKSDPFTEFIKKEWSKKMVNIPNGILLEIYDYQEKFLSLDNLIILKTRRTGMLNTQKILENMWNYLNEDLKEEEKIKIIK